ncbi:MAG: hypothetical protein ABFS18_09005 [Thermodesulfobacteriota bacterium]
MKMSILRNDDGFTILEAVFAAGILAFAILSYTLLKTSSLHSKKFSKELSQAIQLSRSQMDDFNKDGYNDAKLSVVAGTRHLYSELGTLPALQVGDFALEDANWTILDGCPSTLSKLIVFTGEWNQSAATPKSISLTQVQVRP